MWVSSTHRMWVDVTLVKPLSVLAFTFVLFQVLIRPDMTRERENLTKANLKADTAQFSSVQSLNCVRLFATPWTAARQASLSITNS